MPAFNIEAEQYLLGCILVDGDLIKEISLQPEHFYRASHRIIFAAMRELEKKDEPIDVVTVITQIGIDKADTVGGISYLSRLAGGVPTTSTVQTYEKYILDAWKLRQAEMIANKIKEEVAVAKDSSIIGQSIAELSRLDETGYDEDFDLKKELLELDDEFESATEGLKGITTGLNDLNAATNGWQDEDLIIVGARPSMGKTAFALNEALNAAKDGTVTTIFSLEMGRKQLLKRMICIEGKIDFTKLRNPKKLMSPEEYTHMARTMGYISTLPLFIYDKPGTTVQEMRAKVRKLKRKYPDQRHLVIIDYLQLITGSGAENRTQELGEISRALKLMAREYKLPVIALSQLSRSLEQRKDKRPMMSDLRESGNIEQDADVVAFLYRDDYYDPESTQKNVTEVIIAKQRNGPTGTVKLVFLKQFQRFECLQR